MALDILVREFAQDWMISQTNLFCFLQRIFHFPTVAQNTSDHPKSGDARRGSAMNECRPIRWIVSDLQKLCSLFVFRISGRDWDIEISQPESVYFCLFFRGRILGRLT